MGRIGLGWATQFDTSSDWASYPLTQRSLTGWFILLSNYPIFWETRNNKMPSSFIETKYPSKATTNYELKRLNALLLCLSVTHPRPMKLHCDNDQTTLHIVTNPIFHERTSTFKLIVIFCTTKICRATSCTTHIYLHQSL